jgi:hypothetical protein
MGGMTEAQAEHIAQRARAEGEYGEITVHHQEGYGYSVTGRKVVNGQGIGRTWGYGDILLERATCGHPPSSYYGYAAADGTIVMGCCDCGAVLTGAAEDETPAGGVSAGRDEGRGDMATESTTHTITAIEIDYPTEDFFVGYEGDSLNEIDQDATIVAYCDEWQATLERWFPGATVEIVRKPGAGAVRAYVTAGDPADEERGEQAVTDAADRVFERGEFWREV